jgi:lysophospholipase L1-like esterase
MLNTSPRGSLIIVWLRLVAISGVFHCVSANAWFDELPRTIVAFGDSTTARRGNLEVYANLLAAGLGTVEAPVRVINEGVGGNTTKHARQRFQTAVLDRKPGLVIIQFGINDAAIDVWRSPVATEARVDLETYGTNLRYFCQTVKAQDCRVILMTPNPMCWTDKLKSLYGKSPYDPKAAGGFNVVLKEYAKVVRKIAKDEEVLLVDVYQEFNSFAKREGQTVQDLLLDGMHPNGRGHQLIAARLSYAISQATAADGLIASITKETLWRNREGTNLAWFHPRACMIPGKDGKPWALMTLQEIGGSDYFGPVHQSISKDEGKTWSTPQPIAAFGRQPVSGRDDDLKAAVCDVTPQYHAATNTVIAMGHVVFYKGKYFARNEQLPRYPVYAIGQSDKSWSSRKILEWDDPRGAFIYSNNCGQRIVMPDGQIQMSFTFGPQSEHRMVAGVQAKYDGEELKVKQVGPPLKHPHGRGLLEPSVASFADKFWMTMRAENGRGYVSVSDDGLNWEPKRTWDWDDGTPLEMSTTQQHWLTHSDGLFLVYTRKDDTNANVIRWRSPLYVAQVDPKKRCLIKATERVVLPLVGDGVKAPDQVALMGNFNVTNVSPDESWVTVGEWMPRAGFRGDVLLARIRWSKPNRLPLW